MRTLHSYWKELEDVMKKYHNKVFVTVDARVDNSGESSFRGFISLGNYPDEKHTSIHDCTSPEELIQKAEGWAKIITTKLEVESKDILV